MKPARLSLALAVAAGLAGYAWLQWSPPPGRKLEASPAVTKVLGDRGSPAAGAATPDVTVVVFTDYQCPVCKATDPAITRLLAVDPNVRVVWKDWPIRGPMSDLAARTALAAHRQGQYLPVHDALMAARGQLTPARIADVAVEAGADRERLAADLRDHAREIDEQLSGHKLQAFSLGLQGTPTYLVGPYLIQGGLGDRALASAVARARRSGPPR
ncbi:DsbA family protein [Phenylobacterium sp.]|uniref:DsbA family protein n=1 Tax=Phenylobacterium sp. TaxID=1871053 RepID=UPI0025DC72E4|nr:DsbA family protein [Phenylobacterium sp.]